jgi:hypothetical protein
VLTRQDWRGTESWHEGQVGYWEVTVAEAGTYRVTVQYPNSKAGGNAVFKLNGVEVKQEVPKEAGRFAFLDMQISAGNGRLETWLSSAEKRDGAERVWVERV